MARKKHRHFLVWIYFNLNDLSLILQTSLIVLQRQLLLEYGNI